MKITGHKADYQALGPFRNFIESLCKDHPRIDEEILYDLMLVTDVACTNIIAYSYAGMEPGSITPGCELNEGYARLEISDAGKPFRLSEPWKPEIVASLENGTTRRF